METRVKAYSLLIAMLAVGCAAPIQEEVSQPAAEVEKRLEPYILSFTQKTGIKVRSSVRFEKLEKTTVGLCQLWSDDRNTILIDPEYFEKINEEQREELVYHEIGHCELKRDHETRTTEKVVKIDGVYTRVTVPKSVMFPYVFTSLQAEVYAMFKVEYVNELISVRKVP